MTPSSRFVNRLFEPVDAASLGAFRAAFGALMVLETARWILGGDVHEYFIVPAFFFKYQGFGWVAPWPGEGIYLHLAVMGAAAAGLALGLCHRLSAVVFFLAYTYIFLIDQSYYNNHYYLICLLAFLLIFVPAHRAYSLDARWERVRDAPHDDLRGPAATVPRWALTILQFQVAVVYLFAALAKMNGDWLRGEPVRPWLLDAAALSTVPRVAALLRSEFTVWTVAYGGIAFDLFIVPLLLWRRSRPWAFVLVVVFHATNKYLFGIGIFPWLGIAASTLFFAPEWPRRALRFLGAGRPPADALEPASRPLASDSTPPGRAERARVLAALGVYAALQLLLPLRHWLIPGEVSWTEEGHRFSWRMKLRDRQGDCLYIKVADAASRRVVSVDFREWLAPHQRRMLLRPDSLIQFAHYLARHFREERGWSAPQVRCAIMARVNDRPACLLVDPWIDLASQPRALFHDPWVLPEQPPEVVERARPRGRI